MDIIMLALLVVISMLMWRGVNRKYIVTLWLVAVFFLIGEFLPHLNGPKLSF